MPKPVLGDGRYMPGLDGIRALAVVAVIAFHLGFGWAPGGMLGVGVFFTLSGYLITDILLAQWDEGRLRLGEFWLRRARRLLPALFLMLGVVTLWVAVAQRSRLTDLRAEVVSAAAYVNNWWQIAQEMSYFERFGPPSPLGHLWSLSIEEQFYLLWPWMLLLGLFFVPERRLRGGGVRPRLAGATLVLAAVSAIEMAILYQPTFDPSRVYDGTDTRAFGLLFGAALAMVWPSRSLTARVTATGLRTLDVLGAVGLATIAVLVWRTSEYSPFLYQGGMVVLSAATVLVIAVAAHPASRVGRALGWRPLRWLGVRSYGIYLWHQPIIVLTTPAGGANVDLRRAAAQVAATIGIAALSWRYVEEPIRRGALGRLWAQARSAGWRPRALPRRARVAVAVSVSALVLTSVALAGVQPPVLSSSGDEQADVFAFAVSDPPAAVQSAPETSSVPAATAGTGRRARALRSSCRAVIHVGDSTSVGLISRSYLPNSAQRIGARYRQVGARPYFEIDGATSVVETLPGHDNAEEVARAKIAAGYRGCWVLALGTNDTADVYVGSSVGLSTRIQRMMATIGNRPVMWVNVKTLTSGGPYAGDNMRHWNRALIQACSRYPTMRIFDWAAVVRDRWFIPDGIHYTSHGYAIRALTIAKALALSFPAGTARPRSGCVIRANA